MKTREEHIAPISEYYMYTPSAVAKQTFFFPLCTGHFLYQPGYRLRRTSYDSFLLMYVQKGRLTVEYENVREQVQAGSFLLLDCYQPHGYYSSHGWEAVWCHYDGPLAREYYHLIQERLGNIFSMANTYPVLQKLLAICEIFEKGQVIQEALLSKYFTDIMTQFLLCPTAQSGSADHTGIIEETISYINEHLDKDISIDELAAKAMMSEYHFIRIFKEKINLTPHQYVIHARINMAKYMLKNTRLSIKDICFQAGYSRENIFCSSFKKNVGMTPKEYRFCK